MRAEPQGQHTQLEEPEPVGPAEARGGGIERIQAVGGHSRTGGRAAKSSSTPHPPARGRDCVGSGRGPGGRLGTGRTPATAIDGCCVPLPRLRRSDGQVFEGCTFGLRVGDNRNIGGGRAAS